MSDDRTTRPPAATVFGILNLIFGSMGVLGALYSIAILTVFDASAGNPVLEMIEGNSLLSIWTVLSTLLGLVASFALTMSGIGLLKLARWGRRVAIGYGIYAIAMVLIGVVVNWFTIYGPLLEQVQTTDDSAQISAAYVGLLAGLGGTCFGFLYPCGLLYFMTRPRLAAAFEGTGELESEDTGAVAMQSGLPTPEPASPPSDAANPSPEPFAPSAPRDPYAPPSAPLHAPPSQTVQGSGDAGEEILVTVIPIRNKPALISYYLGLFSLGALVPLLGVVGLGMAFAAVRLGLKGRRLALEHPEAKGTVHAWIGILGGAVWGLLGLGVQGAILFAFLAR